MKYLSVFKMPKPVNVMGRTSSITNAFVNGIIPCIQPTEDEVKKSLSILGLNVDSLQCAYCGDKYTEWDHLRPLIKDKKPTGYISDIYNLVPSCGKCNQSKGNKYWQDWITSEANLSPKSRKVYNLNEKIQRLKKYENWKKVEPLNFEELVDKDLWKEHWDNYERLLELMKHSQSTSSKIREQLYQRYQENQKSSNCV